MFKQATPEKLKAARDATNSLRTHNRQIDSLVARASAGQTRYGETGERMPDVRDLMPETQHALMRQRFSVAHWTVDPGDPARLNRMEEGMERFRPAATAEHERHKKRQQHAAASSKRQCTGPGKPAARG